MRILILGNSPHFAHTLKSFLTNNAACSLLRFKMEIIELELVIGTETTEKDINASLWALEAIQADGIIYALVPDKCDPWVVNTSPHTFLSTLTLSNIPIDIPKILVSPSLIHSIPLTQMTLHVNRCVEIDPKSGENCHLALMSLVYWIKRMKCDDYK